MTEYGDTTILHFNPSISNQEIDLEKQIYHYTSPQGLFSILKSASLRFTDCQFLNDISEYTYIKKPLLKAIEDTKLNYDVIPVINSLRDGLERLELTATQTGSNITLNWGTKRYYYYVFCCSTKQDSLGMWNYYVKGGNFQGYNVGFTVHKLLECFSTVKNPSVDVFHGEVLYKERDQIDFLKNLLIRADQELRETNRSSKDLQQDVITYLENFRLFFKDEAFINEQEYRFVLRIPEDYIPSESDPFSIGGFDIKNGNITPYSRLMINKEKTIDSIKLSPMLEAEISKQGIRRYLNHGGYNREIEISLSKVPIRF